MLLRCNAHTKLDCLDSLSPSCLSLSSIFNAAEVYTNARPTSSMLKQAIGSGMGVF